MDSLLTKSLTFEYTFANGRISMDAMPSVLSGIPMMVEPFFLTPASLNDVGGLPKMLKPRGYFSAFSTADTTFRWDSVPLPTPSVMRNISG